MNRIREMREAQSKTRDDLGKAIQKSALTIWRYEEGKSDIPLSSLEKMAAALGVPLEALLARPTGGERHGPRKEPHA
jgi:transcriptional regulator with XRE-family HTH domain